MIKYTKLIFYFVFFLILLTSCAFFNTREKSESPTETIMKIDRYSARQIDGSLLKVHVFESKTRIGKDRWIHREGYKVYIEITSSEEERRAYFFLRDNSLVE